MAKQKKPRSPDSTGPTARRIDLRPADDETEEMSTQIEEAAVADAPAKSASSASPLVGRRTVGYQTGINKNLGRKQRQSFDEVRANSLERRAKLDGVMAGVRDQLRTKHGLDGIYSAEESNDLVVGIPMPSLALEILLDNDVLPLGVVMQILGPWGSCKSALVAEIFRWFDIFGGVNNLIENESKHSPTYFQSIMSFERWNRMNLFESRSVEDWQKRLTLGLAEFKAAMKGTSKSPGLGATFPVSFAIDSMMGKLSDESQKKISAEGSASRSFAVEALYITSYLKTIPQELAGWPFLLILVNHLKEKQAADGSGKTERSFSGGKQTGFQETFEIETSVARSTYETASYLCQRIRLACMKNSLGTGRRKIEVPVKWWHEPDPKTGKNTQVTVFDWHTSTSITLYALLAGQYKSKYFSNVFKQAGINLGFKHPDAELSAVAYCKEFDIPESEALPFEEFGKYVSEHPVHSATMRQLLGINARAIMEGDYTHQQRSKMEDVS